ncbi:unnamed protein product [Meloidogyne enterolobii]|uniref:Uncharacterized protein n=1 Tax=Meloidogyne enterolobii TaxID=390850 RepID=A0ACB1AMJ6_MELEN
MIRKVNLSELAFQKIHVFCHLSNSSIHSLKLDANVVLIFLHVLLPILKRFEMLQCIFVVDSSIRRSCKNRRKISKKFKAYLFLVTCNLDLSLLYSFFTRINSFLPFIHADLMLNHSLLLCLPSLLFFAKK